jgi:hypothetical protein
MKGENYLYFCDQTVEPTATDQAVLLPASTLRGITVGSDTGVSHPARVVMHFEGLVGDGNSKADVTISGDSDVTGAIQIKIVDDVVNAINSNPGDGFVVIADRLNGVFGSPLLTGCNVDSAS